MVAVATITWARSPGEEALLRRSLERLADAHIRVAVADKGTNTAFTTFAGSLPNFKVTVSQREGLVAQVQASVALAATFGTPYILYTEPDKEQFFRHALHRFIELCTDEEEVGIVLAARSDASFRTFPPMQRYVEGVVNHLCGEFVGHPGDYSYGPFLMKAAIARIVAELPSDLGWGWRPFTFIATHRRGSAVRHVTDEYPCLLDQRDEDSADRIHRLRQLRENIGGMLA